MTEYYRCHACEPMTNCTVETEAKTDPDRFLERLGCPSRMWPDWSHTKEK